LPAEAILLLLFVPLYKKLNPVLTQLGKDSFFPIPGDVEVGESGGFYIRYGSFYSDKLFRVFHNELPSRIVEGKEILIPDEAKECNLPEHVYSPLGIVKLRRIQYPCYSYINHDGRKINYLLAIDERSYKRYTVEDIRNLPVNVDVFVDAVPDMFKLNGIDAKLFFRSVEIKWADMFNLVDDKADLYH